MQNWKKPQREPIQLGIKVQVDALAMQKMWQWVDLAKGEVSALGLVEDVRDADSGAVTALIVTDFFLVKQQCSADETTMDPSSVAELLIDLESKGIDGRKLRCWCHSHGDLSVFWSGQDDECIRGLCNGDWLLSLVVNKSRDTMMRLDQYHPVHLYVSDCIWEVRYNNPAGFAEACFAEFKAKVSESRFMFGAGKQRDGSRVEDLKIAQERGAMTIEEMQDEIDWLSLDRDEHDLPF
jgi:hypothetical protein